MWKRLLKLLRISIGRVVALDVPWIYESDVDRSKMKKRRGVQVHRSSVKLIRPSCATKGSKSHDFYSAEARTTATGPNNPDGSKGEFAL